MEFEMMTAEYANEAAQQARQRAVKRDDIFSVEDAIRARMESGWFTLTLMPFSTSRDRTEYVIELLKKNGYNATLLTRGNIYGLDIDWYSRDDVPESSSL